jgi:transposase
LDLIRENKKLDPDKDRVGIFTTALVARNDEHEISFFWSGRRHAGENLEQLMKQRPEGMPLPTLMVDGSSRNVPENLKAILANCLTHGRRQFLGLETSFPAEIAHVINEIACIYRNDAVTKERAMNNEERLRYHQEQSAPIIDELKLWCRDQIESKKTEPNSGLGKAIHYLEKRWTELTVFLRVPGAPLSNDIVERLIKRCVLHRKNSLFYKTLNGAAVGDVLMTLIHTAIAAGKNPFDYLTVLQLHRSAIVKAPADWLPWTYEASAAALSPQ